MTTCFLAPDPIQSTQFIPGGNTPANGGQLFFYAAGSSTKQTVYKDNAAAVAWTNPIVLDSGGNLPNGGEVWFPTGQTFKVIFAPSNDTDPPASPYWTKDNLAGTNDVSAQTGVEWISGPTPTFVSTTQFTLAGDQTATFTVGRRVKTTNTGGTVYSTITSSSFGANTTTVNVVSDGAGVLDSGLSAVSYGLFDPANVSISPAEVNRKGAAVASAGNGTTNIWGTIGDYAHVTGTNGIHHFSTAPYAGAVRDLIFDSSLTLFSSSALLIPGNSNVTTGANDRARVRADTVSTHVIISYQRANALPTGQLPTVTILTTSSQVLSSTGTYTPPAGVFAIKVYMVGGGAGGAASGGTAGSAATNGSSSSFSTSGLSLIAAAGQLASSFAAGSGGSASGGDINISGQDGTDGVQTPGANTANFVGGNGGQSFYGGGGTGVAPASGGVGRSAKNNTGSGGAGGAQNFNSQFTGAGGGAGAYLEKLIINPVSSYSYCIGGGGTAGTAGTSSFAAGAGAAGMIKIEEFYGG